MGLVMRCDERKKLEGMNAFNACHFLMGREDDVLDILDHLEDCDTGESNVVMERLRGYLHLMAAETALLFKVITARNLETAKSDHSQGGSQ